MTPVGGKLSPVVAVQYVIGRCQRNLPSQALVQRRFNLTDHEYATSGGLLQKGGPKTHALFAGSCSDARVHLRQGRQQRQRAARVCSVCATGMPNLATHR